MNKRVLILTGLLPVQEIKHKQKENDILLVTENKIKEVDENIHFDYLFIFPYSNRFLSMFSSRWKSYYQLGQKKTIHIKKKKIFIFPLLLLPLKTKLRYFLLDVFYAIKRNKIKKIIEELNPTIIHAQEADSLSYFAKKIAKEFNLPYLITVRGINRFCDEQSLKNFDMAKTLIALSPTQLKVIPEKYHHKTVFIPHGINQTFFKKNNANNTEVMKIISVARLLKLKNFDLVINCLAHCKEKFVFDIYGEGPEKENLQNLINELNLGDQIKLCGQVKHESLPEIYSSYNLFVMLSFPETLGRVYFEAMAAGLPVVATKNTGIDGLIEQKEQGVLLDPCSNDFQERFIEFLENFKDDEKLRKHMSTEAVNFAGKYSWEHIIPKYLKIYLD